MQCAATGTTYLRQLLTALKNESNYAHIADYKTIEYIPKTLQIGLICLIANFARG